MSKMILKYLLLCLLILLVRQPSEAFASPIVTIAPASDNVYVIQGGDFSGISRVDIIIQYDTAALVGPRVVQGGLTAGAIIVVNPLKQGVLRFTLLRTAAINGSGTIATVTFVRMMSTGADILSLAASAVSDTGQSIRVASQVVNTPKTADSGAATGETTEPQAGRSATESWTPARTTQETTAAPVSNAPETTPSVQPSGAAMMVHVESSSRDAVQAETPSSDSSDPQADPGVPRKDNDSVVVLAKAAPEENPLRKTSKPERKKTMMYKSALERFREFKGKKTPEALIALFDSGGGENRQDPPLVLSDGKTSVKVILELHSDGEDNNFLLDGASLVSLTHKERNYWVVELLPEKNTLEAAVSVPRNSQLHVTPLTVSPPRDVAIGRSPGKEAKVDFSSYLKERGTAKTPRFDLNGDGRRDYVDDYIFTANYIVRQRAAGKTGMEGRK